MRLNPETRMQQRTRTRLPIWLASAPGPAATTIPQQSAPWIGNRVAVFHPPLGRPSVARVAFVPSLTDSAYQPSRVLMSVLLTLQPEPKSRPRPDPAPVSESTCIQACHIHRRPSSRQPSSCFPGPPFARVAQALHRLAPDPENVARTICDGRR